MNAIVMKHKLWSGFLLSYLRLPHFLINPPRQPPPQPEVRAVVIDIAESSTPPPNDDLNPCPAPNINIIAESSPTTMHFQFHPIVVMMRELELGKSFLSIGVPIIIIVLISIHDGKFHATTFAFFVLSGLSIGSMAIWNGIVLRATFPRTANAVEQLGIVMVLLSITGLLASQLPPKFIWVTILCSALSLFPFLIQIFSYGPTNHVAT